MPIKRSIPNRLLVLSALLAVFILVSHICCAQEEDELEEDMIFDDWVVEGGSFQVSGLDVFVSAGDTGGEGILIFPQKTLVLEVGSCGMIDRLKVCISEWEYVRGGTVKIHGEDTQKYHVVITIPAPKLAITRSPAENDMEMGEETRVTVVLRNDGTEPALGITYIEYIPPEFDVGVTNNIDLQWGNRLVWTGSLPPGDEKKFAYNIRAKTSFAGEILAKADYKVHDVPKSQQDSMHIEVRSLINIGQKRDKRELQYGDEDRFYITLENQRSEDADAELTVDVPKGLFVVATQVNSSAAGNTMSWEGTIPGGESVILITRVRADDAGLQQVNISVKGTFADGKITQAQEYININVSIKDAELYFIPKQIKKGEQSKVKVYLKNPNSYAEFSNIDISASSDHFNGTAHMDKYRPAQYDNVLSFDVKPEEAGKFKAKADVTYHVGSAKYTATKQETIQIKEEEVPEEKPPVNGTPVQNGTNETAEAGNQSQEGLWERLKSRELFAVSYSREKASFIKDIITNLFDIRKAISEAIAKKTK